MPIATERQCVLLVLRASNAPNPMPSTLVGTAEELLSSKDSTVTFSSRAVMFRNSWVAKEGKLNSN